MARRIAWVVAGVAVLLIAVVVARALTAPSRQLEIEPVQPVVLDEPAVLARLSAAVQLPTVTVSDGPLPTDALLQLRTLVEERFPRVHATLTREIVADYSLLYTWKGKDPSRAPAVLMAHQDVVPVEPGTENAWTHPPFAGVIADGQVWGRGTLDDKGVMFAILEAVELALARGLSPERTIYLAFGHDEEIGGKGAAAVAQTLASRRVKPGFVLDEGLAIVHELVPGVAAPVAMVGIAEKGYLTLRLSARGEGGHSSMPPRQTAVGVVAAAVAALEAEPFPAEIRGPARQFLEFIGPEADFPFKLAFNNLWLFGGVLESVFADRPSTAALIRTTTAATMFRGSPKDNVLPQQASAAVNFRILPGESVASVQARVREVVADPRVIVEVEAFGSEPSPVSAVDGDGFRALQTTLHQVFPEVVVAPSLVLGATDSRYYSELSNQVFRFSPFSYREEVGEQIHGTDEHISVSDYLGAIRFYLRLVENLAS